MNSFLNDNDIRGLRNFSASSIDPVIISKITAISKKIRRDILTMTVNAASGHIGGSMSSADIYLMLWLCANSTPENFHEDDRDRIVVSHGHTSPGLYAVLGNLGFFNVQDAIDGFRKKETFFEGHPSRLIPGVEWASGSLGQGLSVGCGFSLAGRIKKYSNRIFVVMGDGEQQKGQLTEACEFASKHKLSNLTAIVDVNKLQASGNTVDIMPSDLQKKYEAAGWDVTILDGHDFSELYSALKLVHDRPHCILANTVMGKGYSAIENNFEYHGRILNKTQYAEAIGELDNADYEAPSPLIYEKNADGFVEKNLLPFSLPVYKGGSMVECRTAAGETIYSLVKNNAELPVAVLDCDLMESVKTIKVMNEFPEKFIECGIQEHNAATITGALSRAGVLPFFLDFGVFGIDETYGQHRMIDVNSTSVKIIATHCGLDVGEDGKTHQCLDYISLSNNLPGYRLIVPADANQTAHAVKYIASTPGNFIIAMGRSKVPVIAMSDEFEFFNDDYHFSFGKGDWLKEGTMATVISTGTMVHRALQAAEELSAENISVGVLNISTPGEPDQSAIRKACGTGTVITYEDHWVNTGLGSMVASVIAENQWACRFKKMGVSKYGKSAPANDQYGFQNLDVSSLKKNIKNLLTLKHF